MSKNDEYKNEKGEELPSSDDESSDGSFGPVPLEENKDNINDENYNDENYNDENYNDENYNDENYSDENYNDENYNDKNYNDKNYNDNDYISDNQKDVVLLDSKKKKKNSVSSCSSSSSINIPENAKLLNKKKRKVKGIIEENKKKQEKMKKKKIRINNDIYLKNLPTNKNYQVSYMHTDIVTHVVVSNKKKYIITASLNGIIKFWYKNIGCIEFVKHFKIHSDEIINIFISEDEEHLGSLSKDKTYKQFDITSFDMNIVIKLSFIPRTGEFIYSSIFSTEVKVAISSSEKACIYIYKPLESDICIQTIDFSSCNIIEIIKYNKFYDLCVLSDNEGLLDIVDVTNFKFPTSKEEKKSKTNNNVDHKLIDFMNKRYPIKKINFSFKSETDLYELCKYKTYALCISLSLDGEYMAILSENYFLRIYKFESMKLYRVYDESTEMYLTAQNDPLKKELHIDSFDFGKRLFIEKEIKKYMKNQNINFNMISFDESNQYIIYSTFIGIKVVNFITNQLCYIIGKNEANLRYLSISIYQNIIPINKVRTNIHESLYINEKNISDCALFCTVYKKARFYVFSKKKLNEHELDDRDIYNEQPTKNDVNSLISNPLKNIETIHKNTPKSAIIYTTMGDIHISLFYKECKKTVQNFSVHSINGYYNNCIFHRVIKHFMVQTGDPSGDGTGGESIWGNEFEDEFFDHLNHSKPFMVSMANCGPNTNGSQFFITTVPCPWLDFKHTVFGKVTQGSKIVLDIEKVRTDKRDKPLEDIKILNIKINN